MVEVQAFAAFVRSTRISQGYSQEDFAERCGSARTYISELERGVKEPCLGTIFRIAQALDLSPSELLAGIQNRMYRKL